MRADQITEIDHQARGVRQFVAHGIKNFPKLGNHKCQEHHDGQHRNNQQDDGVRHGGNDVVAKLVFCLQLHCEFFQNHMQRTRSFPRPNQNQILAPKIPLKRQQRLVQRLTATHPFLDLGNEGFQPLRVGRLLEHDQRLVQRHVGLLEVGHLAAEQKDLATFELAPSALRLILGNCCRLVCNTNRRHALPNESQSRGLHVQRADRPLAGLAIGRDSIVLKFNHFDAQRAGLLPQSSDL